MFFYFKKITAVTFVQKLRNNSNLLKNEKFIRGI